MRRIFFDENSERLGGGASRTGRDGVRAARARMGAVGVVGAEMGFLGEKLGGTLRHSERLGVRVVMEV